MTVPDAELARALKQAHLRKLFFAFIPKGTEGKLIVSASKIQPKEIEKAQKELSGGIPVQGTLFGPITGMVFQVANPPPAVLAAMLQKVVKRDTGLNIVVEFRLAALDPGEGL